MFACSDRCDHFLGQNLKVSEKERFSNWRLHQCPSETCTHQNQTQSWSLPSNSGKFRSKGKFQRRQRRERCPVSVLFMLLKRIETPKLENVSNIWKVNDGKKIWTPTVAWIRKQAYKFRPTVGFYSEMIFVKSFTRLKSRNNFTQALLVMLVTNIMSASIRAITIAPEKNYAKFQRKVIKCNFMDILARNY